MSSPVSTTTFFGFLALSSLQAFGQGLTTASNSTGLDYVCVQRGPDSRVWQRSVVQTNTDGSTSTNIQSFKELHSGVCHQVEAGQWVDSVEEIDLTATGAEATQGAYQVQWAANINTPNGAVQLTSPAGQVFSSTVYGLSYRDASTGTNVLIAPLQDSVGQVVGQNQTLYTNAFSGVNADIEYIYKVEGMEQNIVLREQPPSPADFNLNPETTFFEVVTKFFNAPVASKNTVISTNVTDDYAIGFKDMLMGQGVAVLIGDQSQPSESGLRVTKHWMPQEDGSAILFEEIPYSALSNTANALPLHSSNAKPADQIRRTASFQAPSQKAPIGIRNTSGMKITRRGEYEGKKARLVVDYTLNGRESGASNFVFQSDTTYFISGAWYYQGAPGTIIFEGGTVIKYTTNAVIYNYESSSPGIFEGSAYQPSVFTSWEDNSVGTTIPGSSGSPSVVPSTTYYIEDNNGGAWSNYVSNARFSYADYAYTDYSHPVFTFENCQFVNCISATATESGTNIFFKNNLCAECSNVFAGGSGYLSGMVIIDAENITADSCGAFAKTNSWWGPCNYSGGITNSILTGCDGSTSLFATNCTLITNTNTGIYQIVGAGGYYLANGSPYRNAGTTSIDPVLLSDLQTLTTYPPIVFSNLVIATNLTLSPSVAKNTGAPDYGYHYASIDYALTGLTISNANLSVMPGCVVAAFGSPSATTGLMLDYGGTATFQGTATTPVCFVTCSAVQEEWESNVLSFSFFTPMYGITPPTANFQFTVWFTLADQQQVSAADMASIGFQNCQLYGGIFDAISPTLHITNSMLRRVTLTLNDMDGYPSDPSGNWMVNNLLIDGSLQLTQGNTNVTWIFHDNLFDGTGIPQQLTNDVCNHNAYITNCQMLTSTSMVFDVILTNSPSYQTGFLGDYYYPTNQTNLIHQGSESAAAAGLYHYTVVTNNTIEGTNQVSIGFHYVATDDNGNPLDTTGDGLPDYVKDSNGDGVYDAGDFANWLNPYNIYDQGTTYEGYTPENVRLGYWRFNSGALTNEHGDSPYVTSTAARPSDWSGTSVSVGAGTNLQYGTMETNGWTNFDAGNGTVRFWFKPYWSSSNIGGTGPNQNVACATFLNISNSVNSWTLQTTPSGEVIHFECTSNLTYVLSSGGAIVQAPGDWNCTFVSNQWYQIALTYTASNIAAYINGALIGTGVWPPQNGFTLYQNGYGMFVWPVISASTPFSVGNDTFLTAPINGEMDELETFNYPLSAQAIAYGYTTFPGSTGTNIMQDSDYVGRSDLLRTLVDGVTLPDPWSVVPCQLGYWRFKSSDLASEEGQLPTYANGVTLTSSLLGGVLNVANSAGAGITYPDVGSNGWSDINCQNGTVIFWFKPTAFTSGPLVYLGNPGNPNSQWSINASGASSVTFISVSNTTPTPLVTATCNLSTTNWTQIALVYGTGNSTFYVNGHSAATGSAVSAYPSPSDRHYGMVIGNNTAYNSVSPGQFAEVQTFNYELSSGEILNNFATVQNINSNLNGVPDIISDVTLGGSTPFFGNAPSVTATIEAEQFDRGGPGIAYSNVAAHGTNWYRNTGMCITNCGGSEPGYCLDQTQSNEWANYTINVLVPQTYAIDTRVQGLGTNGAFELSFATNGHVYTNTGPLAITSANWTNVTGYASLAAGANVMRLQLLSNGMNGGVYGPYVGRFNYMTVYPWWNPPTFPSTTPNYVSGLGTGSDFSTASNNAYLIQLAVNSLPSTGGVVEIEQGTFYVAQAYPNEALNAYANAVVGITNSNIKLCTAGTNTWLIGYNRATTMVYVGADREGDPFQCTNIALQDLTFQAQPHMAVSNGTGTNVIYETGQLYPVGFNLTGGLTFFAGPDVSNYAYNILITNCEFLNADRSIEIPNYTSNILIRDCTFLTWQGANGYVPGQTNAPPNSTSNTGPFYFGVGIYGQSIAETNIGANMNIGVVECGYNGNPNATNYITSQEGANNGFILYQEGGNFFVLRNFITNNAEETIQFSTGPSAIAGNTFRSWGNNNTSCALAPNFNDSLPGATGTGYSNYSVTFVGNSVTGNSYGACNDTKIVQGPYALNFSGNSLALYVPPTDPTPFTVFESGVYVWGCQSLNVCGNTMVSGGTGVMFYESCSNSVILANNFSGVTNASIVDWGAGPENSPQAIGNVLGSGNNSHLKAYFFEGPNWFLYNNQYVDVNSNSIPVLTDPTSLWAHISP